MEVFVVGKQWMWKLQHPEGQREINELHIPVGQPIKLTMTTEDVIHSFLRAGVSREARRCSGTLFATLVHADQGRRLSPVLRGILRQPTFRNDRLGSSSCEPATMKRGFPEMPAAAPWRKPAQKLFGELGCVTCHKPDGAGRAPSLLNVYGHPVQLERGGTAMADENLHSRVDRESALQGRRRVTSP